MKSSRAGWLMCALLISGQAQAEAYRWVDAQGRVHYTQTPPPGQKSEAVRPAPPPSPGSNGLKRYSDLNDKLSAEQAKKEAEETAKRDDKAGKCARAKARMEPMQTLPMNRLAEKDDVGNVTRMTPERYEELRAQAQKDIDKYCSD